VSTISVHSRFNGPPSSGNGGYSCGIVANALEGSAAVSLRRPVPLARELELRHEDDGRVSAFDGEALIAEAVPAAALAPWDHPAVGLAEARAARDRYAAPLEGEFGHCFVCGRSRHDGFDIFTGPVQGGGSIEGGLVASPWTPPSWAADEGGAVLPEFVWAALDCPGYFALHGADMTVAYLARQQVEIVAPIRTGVEYVVVGRPLERSGRKGTSATAVIDLDGTVLAHAECLLVVPRAT
jgi:hypothetical protein